MAWWSYAILLGLWAGLLWLSRFSRWQDNPVVNGIAVGGMLASTPIMFAFADAIPTGFCAALTALSAAAGVAAWEGARHEGRGTRR